MEQSGHMAILRELLETQLLAVLGTHHEGEPYTSLDSLRRLRQRVEEELRPASRAAWPRRPATPTWSQSRSPPPSGMRSSPDSDRARGSWSGSRRARAWRSAAHPS